MKQSVYGGKKNQFLLQEEEKYIVEEPNDNTDVNAEADKINDNKKDMVVTMKEDKRLLNIKKQ